MPAADPRGSARGRPLSGPAPLDQDFRCSLAAEGRADDVAGTATHLGAFLLVEHHGPWGVRVPQDSRMPAEVKRHLLTHRSVRVLLARRHLRAHRGRTYRLFLAVPRRGLLLTSTFEALEELLDLDVDGIAHGHLPDWTEAPGPIYGVCTHGRHDVCCAERGRPVVGALTGVRPGETWEVSHLGGDRFAANMLVLPEGLYYGRLDPESALRVVERHEERRLDLDRLRGSTTMPMAAQYAEIALRRHLDDDRLGVVRLERRDEDAFVFAHAGQRYAVTVRRSLTESARLTCTAERLNPVPVHELVSIRQI